ncbi:hypothetical protein G4B88_003678 [Cannabis sativa]|uniref:RNase H type-1 domain-containing protein n=1 Tax=Cannabis sativa TaxID=3483 RepID=A0A7J6E562_CANSA|nr:hypothetical protein G4B88_003678 [Cannabis sativa]
MESEFHIFFVAVPLSVAYGSSTFGLSDTEVWDLWLRVDASILDEDVRIGLVQYGFVDDVAVMNQSQYVVGSVLKAELVAIHKALALDFEKNCSSILIKSDSAVAVKALPQESYLLLGGLILFLKIACLCQLIYSCVSFKFLPHAENLVADKLAYLARVYRVCRRSVVREAIPFVIAI